MSVQPVHFIVNDTHSVRLLVSNGTERPRPPRIHVHNLPEPAYTPRPSRPRGTPDADEAWDAYEQVMRQFARRHVHAALNWLAANLNRPLLRGLAGAGLDHLVLARSNGEGERCPVYTTPAPVFYDGRTVVQMDVTRLAAPGADEHPRSRPRPDQSDAEWRTSLVGEDAVIPAGHPHAGERVTIWGVERTGSGHLSITAVLDREADTDEDGDNVLRGWTFTEAGLRDALGGAW